MKTIEKNKYKFIRTKKSKKTWDGIPAFIKRYDYKISLYNDFFASIICHIIGAIVLWGLTFLLAFWGINNVIFPKPQPKMPDIEFILNNKAKYKVKKYNSNAMGASKEKAPDANVDAPPAVNKDSKHQAKQNNASSKSVPTIPDNFSMPMPKIKASSSGSGGLSRRISSSNGSETSSGSDFGAKNGSNPKGVGTGNGTGFNKENTRKIVSSYDISPYVNELKRTIRWNWKPPKNGENKNVELFLRIAKDGKIIILNVKRTSEIAEVDNAALNAVRRSEPLSPLPSKYSKSYLDVVFTFNSNLSSLSGRY